MDSGFFAAALEVLDAAATQHEKRHHAEVEGVQEDCWVAVSTKNAVRARSVKAFENADRRRITTSTRSGEAPHRTVAINVRHQRNMVSAKRARGVSGEIPEATDVADHWIAEGLGAYVNSVRGKTGKHLIASIDEVADAACRMLRIPIVADGVIGENIDV